jgi:hypothetical protein
MTHTSKKMQLLTENASHKPAQSDRRQPKLKDYKTPLPPALFGLFLT